MKRIGFVISSQTLIPHGGIGQFAKSFCGLMTQHGHQVDIITDKAPAYADFAGECSKNIIYPTDPYRYTDHVSMFAHEDTYCYERMANFRNAILKAFEQNLYDVLICNTFETVQVAATMGIDDLVQIIAYTHLASQIFSDHGNNPFQKNTNRWMKEQLKLSGITVGTQSAFNKESLGLDAWHLPIPLSEPGLLKKYVGPREGVLFIGRWESAKNPELFIDLIDKTKLPARVMTSPSGVKKFENALQNINAVYDVRGGITGEEKVQFISSSRLAFNPSVVESFGMAFQEQMIQLPTVVLENQRWTKNFQRYFFFDTDKKSAAEEVSAAYAHFEDPETWYNLKNLAFATEDEAQIMDRWQKCFDSFIPKQTKSDSARILEHDTIKYAEHIESLGRKVLTIDDIRSVAGNRHKFNVVYTQTNTYLSKDPGFTPDEEKDELFKWS